MSVSLDPQARARINAAIETLRRLWPNHDGPAHIVLADFNLRDSDIEWCITQIVDGERYTDEPGLFPGHPVFTATRAVLEWLATANTAEEREAWADDPYASFYGKQ